LITEMGSCVALALASGRTALVAGNGFDQAQQAVSPSIDHVYQAEIRKLIALGTTLTGDPASGEDLAQDAFVLLVRRVRRQPDYLREPAWPLLRTLLVRLAAQRRRTLARELRRLIRLYQPETTGQWEPDPTLLDWQAALLRLPPRMRACVVLFYGEDLSTASVASALGCSPRTVENQLRLARRKLAPALGLTRSHLDSET
jgi:RNA polymerase sigma factor (sigma-70 family)